jgi:hypothetical protein
MAQIANLVSSDTFATRRNSINVGFVKIANLESEVSSLASGSSNTFTTTVEAQNIIPAADDTYSLGTPSLAWKDVYVGPGSLYVNGQKVLEDDSGTITFTADSDQSLTIKTLGSGETTVQSVAGVNLTATESGDISITTSSGNIELKGTVQLLSGKRITDSAGTKIEFGDDIDMNSNKITELGTPSADSDAATKAYVDTSISALANSAPETLNTLNELAAALNDDENFATTVTTALGTKVETTSAQALGSAANVLTISGNTITLARGDSTTDTVSLNATSANTANTIVSRDGSGNFSAGTITAALTGTASAATLAADATKLATPRAIEVSGAVTGTANFDGSAAINIVTTNTADPTITLAGDLSGAVTLTNLASGTLTATVADDSHNHVISNVDGLQAALDAKAPLASPALTGVPTAPTAATNTNNTQIATTAYVQAEITDLIGGAPGALDTLNELAAAIGDDANFSTTITNSIASKLTSANVAVTVGASSITTTQDDVALNDEALVNPAGFLTINLGGSTYKLPYFS